MPSNTDLWQRIEAFDIDDSEAEFPFSARLSRENGWTREEALAAIDEYKRFIYLLCVSPSHLTPSEMVDQVWHLHLVYTRSYWKDFCDGVLGRPVHHEPTMGGADQAQLFAGQYAQTRLLYETEFGIEPSSAYWPLDTFATLVTHRWVNQHNYWLIPKQAATRIGFGIVSIALFAYLASGGGAWASEPSGEPHTSLAGRLIGLTVFFLPFWLMAGLGRPEERGWSYNDGSS